MRKSPCIFILLVCVGILSAYTQPAVTSFTLINADTDQPIKTLVNGDILNYSTLPTRNLNIRANTNPSTVGSVVFMLNGNRKVENIAPYSYAGETISGAGVNYNKITPPLAAGPHVLTATAYGSANGGGTVGTTHTVSFSVVENTSSNTPPTAHAGPDKHLTLPANSTTLSGSASDAGGSIISYLWTKQSGPAATLSNTTTPTLSVSNMVAGTYVFRLTVTDNQGATGYDEATVTVAASGVSNPAITSFTLVNADNEQDIRTLTNGAILDYATLPTRNLNIRANTYPARVGSVVFFLDGIRKNENIPPYTYAGEVVSGTSVNYNKITPELAAGSHSLAATAYTSSNGGGTAGATHTVSFSVVGINSSNTPPTAHAGPDKHLTLPANSTTLSGSASDAGGSIISYLWTKQSGPAATLSNTTTPTLSVSNMVAGTYVFRLTVTDNQGATGYDEAVVVVNTAGSGGGTCAVFNEQNGLAAIEIESQPATADWSLRTSNAGYTGSGYYEWRHGNTNTGAIGAGTGIITYTIQINTPGRYRLQIRSAAPERTDFNDVWIKFPEGNGVGIRGTSNLALGANWFKVYHNVSNNTWTWETKTKDHDPHDIYVDFPSAGTYRVQFSGRSNQFKIDRFVLYHSSVATSTAANTGNPQSPCAGSSKQADAGIEGEPATPVKVYPNPSAGNVTLEFFAEQAGPASIRLFDARGALIATLFEGNMEAAETKKVAFDGSKLPKGIYIARLIARDQALTRQIVFQ